MLDTVSQAQARREREERRDKTHKAKSVSDALVPFSVGYRVELLKAHRAGTWQPFQWEGRTVTFEIWRASQLRLLLVLVRSWAIFLYGRSPYMRY